MKSTVSLLLILLILGPVAAGTNASAEPAIQGEPAVIPLQDYMGMLATLQIGIGEQSLPFFFDTGGGLTVITPAVADSLGIVQFGQVTGFRMSGERVDLTRCEETTMRIGPREIRVEPTVFDLMSLIPPGLPEVGGLVSLHTFRDQAITIDLGAATLVMETAASLKERVAGMAPLSIRFSRQAAGESIDLMVEAKAQTGTLWLEVDTGNTGSVLLATHALEQLGLVAGEDVAPWSGQVSLDIIGLGEIEVTAVETDLICDGVLNIETIKKLILSIDLATERAWAGFR